MFPLAEPVRRGQIALPDDVSRGGCPALLVSVRDEAEAADALAGGCDVLDVKEPAVGSLGFAGFDAVRQIAALAQAAGVPCTAAFGEAADWLGPRAATLEPIDGLAYAKIGLAGFGNDASWKDRWWTARRRIDAVLGRSVDRSAGSLSVQAEETNWLRALPALSSRDDSSGSPRWVAVAYADWREAQAPSPFDVAAAAVEAECAGLLIDTYAKSGRTLPDILSPGEIVELIEPVRRAGLFVALAGSLHAFQIEQLLPLKPDVVAVRTAACRGGDRTSPIDRTAVTSLRNLLCPQSPGATTRSARRMP